MKAIYFDGTNGEKVRDEAIPAEHDRRSGRSARHHMLEALSMYSDELMEMLLAEEEVRRRADSRRRPTQAVQSQEFTPVFLGSAYQNKGVQPLLDAIVRYLPSPLERRDQGQGSDRSRTRSSRLTPDPTKPFVGMAFKIVEDPFGQLTFMRIYQGKVDKGRHATSTSAPARRSASAAS